MSLAYCNLVCSYLGHTTIHKGHQCNLRNMCICPGDYVAYNQQTLHTDKDRHISLFCTLKCLYSHCQSSIQLDGICDMGFLCNFPDRNSERCEVSCCIQHFLHMFDTSMGLYTLCYSMLQLQCNHCHFGNQLKINHGE